MSRPRYKPLRKQAFFRTKDFLALQKEWYAKAAETGYDDFEWISDKTGTISDYFKHSRLSFSKLQFTAAYYNAAFEVALETLMANEFDYSDIQLFALHADGVPGRDSADIMELSRETVRKRLKPFLMLIRMHVANESL